MRQTRQSREATQHCRADIYQISISAISDISDIFAITDKSDKTGKQPYIDGRVYTKSFKPAISAKPAKTGQDYAIYKQASCNAHSFSCHPSQEQQLLTTHIHINKPDLAERASVVPAKTGWKLVIHKGGGAIKRI